MSIIRLIFTLLFALVSICAQSQTPRKVSVSHVDGPQLGKYGIVIQSFGVLSNAKAIQKKLNSKGYNATIVKHLNLYRVVAFSSNTLSDLATPYSVIKQSYPDSWCLENENFDSYSINNTISNTPQTTIPVQQTPVNYAQQKTTVPSATQTPSAPVKKMTASLVDKNIPVVNQVERNTFAVVIGNEKYKNEENVPYAENDANVFREYLHKTLGVPEKQIKYVENAGLNDLRIAVRWLKQAMEVCNGQGKAIFYYAGHGIPDEADKTAYLLPTDGIGSDVESAYSLQRLYEELSKMPASRTMVFLDACFSGSKREGGMMASARGVAIKVKPTTPQGNMVVFTAAQSDETAYPLKEQQHGMFTYYLLKMLQNTKGNVTLGELSDYLTTEVKRESFVENNKIQTPSVKVSTALQSSWRSLKLK